VERAFFISPPGGEKKEVNALERTQKEQVVAELSEKFAKAKSLTFTEYKGLSVAEANRLRRDCRKAGIEYLVAKNTLIRLALPEAVRDRIEPFLVQTTSVAIDYEDGVLGPKTLANFAKEHAAVKLKAGVLDGEVLDQAGVTQLSKLPGKEELLAKILGSIQAPATNILRCINGVGTKMAGLFRAYREKLEKEAA
jgi:large subunit ribosomal protein L10